MDHHTVMMTLISLGMVAFPLVLFYLSYRCCIGNFKKLHKICCDKWRRNTTQIHHTGSLSARDAAECFVVSHKVIFENQFNGPHAEHQRLNQEVATEEETSPINLHIGRSEQRILFHIEDRPPSYYEATHLDDNVECPGYFEIIQR